MSEEYQNLLYLKRVIKITIARAEKLKARRDNIAKGVTPKLPEANYPLSVKCVDARNPPPVPSAYLLSVNEARINGTRHVVHPEIGVTEKRFKQHLADGYGKIYPVSPNIAESSHLLNCVRQGADLVLTPKDNLFEAEKSAWTRDNMNFGGNVYTLTIMEIEMYKRAGWDITPPKYHTTTRTGEILDVDKALKDLYRLRAKIERYNDKKSFNAAAHENGI